MKTRPNRTLRAFPEDSSALPENQITYEKLSKEIQHRDAIKAVKWFAYKHGHSKEWENDILEHLGLK